VSRAKLKSNERGKREKGVVLLLVKEQRDVTCLVKRNRGMGRITLFMQKKMGGGLLCVKKTSLRNNLLYHPAIEEVPRCGLKLKG